MSLKENIGAVKGELSKDSELLEYFIRAERYLKRYKKLLVALGAVAVAGLLAWGVMGFMESQRHKAVSAAYTALSANPDDQEALATLQNKSPELYDLVMVQKAAKAGDTAALKALAARPGPAGAMAAYQSASLEGTAEVLGTAASKEKALLKEYALLQKAVQEFKAGKTEAGKQTLAMIPYDSPFKSAADMLMGYGAN